METTINLKGVSLPFVAFIFSLILFTIYFKKRNKDNESNNYYFKMLSLAIIDSILVTYLQTIPFGGVSEVETLLLDLVNKIDFVVVISYCSLFFLYTFHIAYNRVNDKLIKINYVLLVMFAAIIFICNTFLIEKNGNYSIGGSATVATYIACALYVFASLILVLVNIKKRDKRFIPVFSFIVILVCMLIIYSFDPYFVFISYSFSLLNLIMYFTLENPDEKIFKIEEKMKNLAIEANKNKSNFLSNMSHELRTPLNVVVGLSEDIDSYKDMVPKDVQEDSIDIQNASNTLLEIIGNILDISKIESGKFELVPTYYDPKEEFESLSKIMRTKVAEKPIEFTVSIDPELPKVLYGDRIRIKQIINNFLSNAIKYTDRGKVDFIVKWIKESSALDIRISDTGNGIKPEDMDKLFTKFERLQVEKVSAVQGTGLGLAITKELIELMNGTVNVESEYKKGSVFKVLLPQTIGSEVELNKLKNQANYGSIQLDLTGKKVLIVDDNELNIKVLKKAIKNYNFDIDTCTDGQVALNKLSTVYYDLVFMDIRMPSMNGVTVFEEVHKMIGFRTPIIALTADAMTGSKEKYLELGFADYLAKPFSRRKLAEKIAKLFEIPTIQSNQTVIQNVNIQTDNFNNKNKEQVLEMVSNQIQQLGNQSQPIVIENVTVNITNDKQE